MPRALLRWPATPRHLRLAVVTSAAAALPAVLAGTALTASADTQVCGGQNQPNCPQVTYVQPEYLLPGQPATVTLQGTDMGGITSVVIVPVNVTATSRHVGPDAISVDVPALPAGNYFFQLELAPGPAPLVDGGGVVVDPSGGPTGPRAPRPTADPSPAAAGAAVQTPTPTPQPTPPAPAPTAVAPVAAVVTARLPVQDDTMGTLLRVLVGVAVICALVEAINLLHRRRTQGGRRGAVTAPIVIDQGVVAGGKANRLCASCGTGGAAVVRWRFENGSGLRVPLCRRCR